MADLAQTLNQMLERLQDDFRRLSEFASDWPMSCAPISNMLTQTQVTLATPRENAAYRDILASNAEELQRLARMVADMLLLAKTERGVDLPHKEASWRPMKPRLCSTSTKQWRTTKASALRCKATAASRGIA
jgi:two-component system heavy metal sensor histidine kinase CusS